MNQIQVDIHPLNGVPISHRGNALNTFYCYNPVPVLPFSAFYDRVFMINFINTTLDEIESITKRTYQDSDCSWRIEYGTKSLEEIVKTPKERATLSIGRLCAVKASEKAGMKFGIVFTEEDDLKILEDEDLMVPDIFIKKWSLITIHLCFNLFSNCYVLYINKKLGNNASYTHVSNKLENQLRIVRNNSLWNLRKNYIKLLEGLPEQTGRDNVLTYLFDEGILKAVCELIR